MEKHYLDDREKILVKKDRKSIFVLSAFSETDNIATRFIEGNENSFFLPKELPLEEWNKGRLFAKSWDNHAPWVAGHHGIIGANHGSPFTFRVTMLRHWLFQEDLGKVLTDDAGERFVLLSIQDLSTFFLHSDVPDEGKAFCAAVTGSLHLEGKTFLPEKVEKIMMNGVPGGQLSPHQRYNSIRLLADGKREIGEGEVCECSFAELFWDMDLILPDDLLIHAKSHPGKYVSPHDPALPGAIKCEMTTFFQPGSCRRIRNKVTFLRDFSESLRYGMIQYYSEVPFSLHEKLVPGLKRSEISGIETDPLLPWKFPEKSSVSHFFTKKDALSPDRIPNCFMDLFGNGGKRELGVALGYSSSCGITARGKEAERGETFLYLYRSGKIYPYAFEKASVKAGESFTLHAFHQYFLPDERGICCFQHEEEDGYFLYVFFPEKIAEYIVSLPERYADRAFALAEGDEGISFVKKGHSLLFHAENGGGIVLKG